MEMRTPQTPQERTQERKDRNYGGYILSEHEKLAVSFVEVIHELRNLIKKKRKDKNTLDVVAEYMAEMFRGSEINGQTDLDLLEVLIRKAQNTLAVKMGRNVEDDEDEDELDMEAPIGEIPVPAIAIEVNNEEGKDHVEEDAPAEEVRSEG